VTSVDELKQLVTRDDPYIKKEIKLSFDS